MRNTLVFEEHTSGCLSLHSTPRLHSLNKEWVYLDRLITCITVSAETDPSFYCVLIHKLVVRSMIPAAHPTWARGTARLLLILYRSQHAIRRANETGSSSLHAGSRPVQQFSHSQTEEEMSEEGAEQTSHSKQETAQTNPKLESWSVLVLVLCCFSFCCFCCCCFVF